ncbi:MAG TPA: hypothetical protein VGX76_24980 [Pirellulales bacterium]|nr:hypothetical protein [Pirellulales bacterium]
MTALPFFDYSALPADEHSSIERSVGTFTMLAQVLNWGRGFKPAVVVDEIVTMDEYTHDVLVKLPYGRYLAFDTT